jgi:hypothetical protein
MDIKSKTDLQISSVCLPIEYIEWSDLNEIVKQRFSQSAAAA